jgi:hypothetical protein
MPKLNQIVAIEKGVKGRVYGEITEMHKASQKADLFNGFAKTYRRLSEEGENYPAERKIVQMQADNVLKKVGQLMTEIVDVTAAKDFANCSAKADISVNGTKIAAEVPATHLLFLEKQLTDLRTFIEKLPVLDEADEWQKDESSGLFKTASIATHRTKKTQRPIVLYDATKEHPAQTQLIVEDVLVGYWDTVKHSGALPAPRKAVLLVRVEQLLKAVKFAREEANSTEAQDIKIGGQVFAYLFA